jgi:ribosomal protein S18 acetylase RimI-like enzyme
MRSSSHILPSLDSTDVLVRRIAPADDAARAGRIVQAAYFALDGYPREDEYDRMLGEVTVRADEADVVVAILDGHIVGCLTFVPGHDNPHFEFVDDDAASFRYFGVDPATAGRGVGEAMVRWCIDEARRLGRARLRIHTLTMMHRAQRLYERLGFVRDPAHDEEWDGIVGLAYRLDL